MIRSCVYFHGPLTEWQGSPAADETIAEFESRWRWLARWLALEAFKRLNTGRCGVYVADERGNVLDHIPALMKSVYAP